MKAKDIMSRSVISVDPDDTIAHAIRLMLQHHISGLPVIGRDGSLLGIVTEGDFLRRVETATERQRPRWLEFLVGPGRIADEYVRAHGRKVREIMTPEPIIVGEDTALQDIVTLMEKRRIKRVPVIREGRVVGIVSRANLLHALASVASQITPVKNSDEAIRSTLLADLEKQKWAPKALIDITVRDGVVDLWGTITDERERQAMIVAAENNPGVKQVNDHLAWIDPMSGMLLEAPTPTEPPKPG